MVAAAHPRLPKFAYDQPDSGAIVHLCVMLIIKEGNLGTQPALRCRNSALAQTSSPICFSSSNPQLWSSSTSSVREDPASLSRR